MKKIELSGQVLEFIRTQAPEPRKLLRAALHKLEQERGDIKTLEGPLKNYCRLRVSSYRIIFIYGEGGKTIQCIYADRRSTIYTVFEQLLQQALVGKGKT